MVKDIKRNTPEANHLSELKTLDYDLQVQTQGHQGRGQLVVILSLVITLAVVGQTHDIPGCSHRQYLITCGMQICWGKVWEI